MEEDARLGWKRQTYYYAVVAQEGLNGRGCPSGMETKNYPSYNERNKKSKWKRMPVWDGNPSRTAIAKRVLLGLNGRGCPSGMETSIWNNSILQSPLV